MSKEVFNEGPTTSQHIEAKDNDHFQKNSFKLKRTRSMGLLDNFINPSTSTDDSNNNNSNNNNIPDDDSIPSFYRNVIPSSSSSSKKNSFSPSSISTGHSDEISDLDNYNSDSSASSLNSSISLTPKHQLKKQQKLSSINNNNNTNNNSNSATSPTTTTSVPHPHLHVHDDCEVQNEPRQHVDYLSHDWNESDISKSWRYVVLKRNDNNPSDDSIKLENNENDSSTNDNPNIVNHRNDDEQKRKRNWARLENASWRTWAQARNNLKTISPAELNWSKESDVTWLYGPLYTDNNENNMMGNDFDLLKPLKKSNSKQNDSQNQQQQRQQQSSNSSYINNNEHLKPILKKKSMVEKVISDASYLRLQNLLEEHDKHKYNRGSPVLESTANSLLNKTPSPSGLGQQQLHQQSQSNTTTETIDSPLLLSANQTIDNNINLPGSIVNEQQLQQRLNNPTIDKKSRRIHFNLRVDQCISVDVSSSNEEYSDSDYDVDNDDENNNINNNNINNNNNNNNESNDNSAKFNTNKSSGGDVDMTDSYDYVDDETQSKYQNSSSIVRSKYHDDFDHHYDDGDEYMSNNSDNEYDYDSDDDSDDGLVISTTVSNISHNPPNWSNKQTRTPSINSSASNLPNDNNNTNINKNNASSNSVERKPVYTIAPLPATTLKNYSDDEEENYDVDSYNPYTLSHNTKTNRGYDYHYNYNTVYSDYTVNYGVPVPPSIYDDYSAQSSSSPTPDISSPSIPQTAQLKNESLTPSVEQVEIYDVPESCQLEGQTISPEDGLYRSVPSPLQSSWSNNSSINNNNNNNNNDTEMFDVPESIAVANETFDVPTNLQDNSSSNSTINQPSNYQPTNSLKRSSSHKASSGSLSTIKMGLSGLDLSSSGLRKSTGAGSRPQLFQLAYQSDGNTQQQQQQQQPPSRSTSGLFRTSSIGGISISNLNLNKQKSFVLNSDSENDSDDEDKEEKRRNTNQGSGIFNWVGSNNASPNPNTISGFQSQLHSQSQFQPQPQSQQKKSIIFNDDSESESDDEDEPKPTQLRSQPVRPSLIGRTSSSSNSSNLLGMLNGNPKSSSTLYTSHENVIKKSEPIDDSSNPTGSANDQDMNQKKGSYASLSSIASNGYRTSQK